MDGVGDCRAPQVEGAAGGGEPVFATAAGRPAASSATAPVAWCRSALLDPGKAMVSRLAGRAAHCAARDGIEMAPRRMEGLLALALKTAGERRTPPDFSRAEGTDPADGFREPLLGSTTDPSRAGEVGIQGFCPHRSEVYAPALCREAVTRLAGVSQPPCPGYLGVRFLLSTDDLVPDLLCLLCDPSCQPRGPACPGDSPSDGGMGGTTDRRMLRLGSRTTALSHP